MKNVKTDPYSQVPLYIKFMFEEQELAVGTAFFYKHNNELFLVSNWHNFSGRYPDSKEPMSKTAGIPNKVLCYACLDDKYIKREWLELNLSDQDTPLWYEHPVYHSEVDIGVLPVELPSKFRAITINELHKTEMRLEVSHDVFITGYPLGLITSLGMPIWKRASIASEPGGSAARFFVDTATRSGMSGSPVIHRFRGFYKNNLDVEGVDGNDDWFGEGSAFVGVYSGRLGASEIEAQLGIVWKEYLIEEIIEGQHTYTC